MTFAAQFEAALVRTIVELVEEHEPLNISIRQDHKDPHMFHAHHNGQRVATATWWKDLEHGKPSIFKSVTRPDYRRRGVMAHLYRHIEKHIGTPLTPASALSDEGHAFWSHYRPEAVKDDLRNHRDKLLGKPIRHDKYGPGVIDRVGARVAMAKKENGDEYPANRELLKRHGYIQD